MDDGRRELLKTLVAGVTGATLCGALARCGWAVNPATAHDADAPDTAGRILFERDRYPELTAVGGAVILNAATVGVPILVVRSADAEYHAMSALCTHLACPVGYVADKQRVECPCHGAQFSLTGTVLRPPAKSPLTRFPTRIDPDTGKIVVDTLGSDVPAVQNGVITIDTDDLGKLDAPDSAFIFTPTGMDRPILVVRTTATQVAAMDAICTFGACALDYVVERHIVACPCHSCEYDTAGAVRKGPATRALKTYATQLMGTTVRIAIV